VKIIGSVLVPKNTRCLHDHPNDSLDISRIFNSRFLDARRALQSVSDVRICILSHVETL